jgi:hypothetical protein
MLATRGSPADQLPHVYFDDRRRKRLPRHRNDGLISSERRSGQYQERNSDDA